MLSRHLIPKFVWKTWFENNSFPLNDMHLRSVEKTGTSTFLAFRCAMIHAACADEVIAFVV